MILGSHGASLKGSKQKINSLQRSLAISLIKFLICPILALPDAQEESLKLPFSDFKEHFTELTTQKNLVLLQMN